MKNRRITSVVVLLLGALSLQGCGGRIPAAPVSGPLLDPLSAEANQLAPEVFRALFETTEGDFVVEVERALAPNGADRFFNLVANGFYDGVAFYRVVNGVIAQFGIHGDSLVNARWQAAVIPDDPVLQRNTRGTLTLASTGQPNSRATEVFINIRDNQELDDLGFASFGRVVEGMGVVARLYPGYGDGPPNGEGPSPDRLQIRGNSYLKAFFPELDYVERATIVVG